MSTEKLIPTKDEAMGYLQIAKSTKIVEDRISMIADKINPLLKNIFKVHDRIELLYVCHFIDDKLHFSVRLPPHPALLLPPISESCLWNDTDLHIELNLLQTDLEEIAKKVKDFKAEEVPSTWKKIKIWIRNNL